MITSTRSGSSAPCGCGGAHASVSPSGGGCGCGCGGHGGCATADCRDGAIVRPLFFAGQLLTEEDLQALSEYVAAKSRLHNRNLFGEGVVCGFEVVRHPCGGGKVIVRPGHALDCCGNDVVLSSAQTLDVNVLVRELRKKLRDGIDCGDPCAEPGHGEPRQRYCLYAHYCETRTDPVSAFVTDEPCGMAACEPTRLREGLRFELRCGEKARPVGDAIKDLTAVDHVIQQAEEGIALERQGGEYKPAEMTASTKALEEATPTDPKAPLAGLGLRNLVARMDVVRVHVNRFNSSRPRRTEIPPEITAAGKALDAAAPFIVTYVKGLPKDPDDPRSTLEKAFIRRVVELAEAAINAATTTPETESRSKRVLWPDDVEDVPKLTDQLDKMLCSLAERLRGQLDSIPEATVCHLRGEVLSLVSLLCQELPEPRKLPEAIGPARRLRDAWWQFLRECIDPALLSPCVSCEDPGVLIACLEVEKCEVVRVDRLERTFVPTAAALRVFIGLLRLVADRESWDLRLAANAAVRALLAGLVDLEGPAPRETAPVEPAPAFDREELIRAIEERLDLAAVRRLETTQKKNTEGLKQAQSELEGLRRELGQQMAKNAELAKLLKALEGRRKP